MTTITLEVPDELAAQFKLDPAELPVMLREAVQAKLAALKPGGSGLSPSLSREVVDFLAATPTLEQIADFTISASAQERLEELLDKQREAEATAEEKDELEKYLQYRHIMVLLKASARRVLSQRPS